MPAMSRNDMIVVCIFIIYYFLLNEVFTTFYNKLELSMIFYNIDFNNSHVKIIYLVDPVPPCCAGEPAQKNPVRRLGL